MPAKSVRIVKTRPNPHDAAGELKRFIGICAQARKQLDPENIKANVGAKLAEFVDGLDQDSKDFLTDVAGVIRRPR